LSKHKAKTLVMALEEWKICALNVYTACIQLYS